MTKYDELVKIFEVWPSNASTNAYHNNNIIMCLNFSALFPGSFFFFWKRLVVAVT